MGWTNGLSRRPRAATEAEHALDGLSVIGADGQIAKGKRPQIAKQLTGEQVFGGTTGAREQSASFCPQTLPWF